MEYTIKSKIYEFLLWGLTFLFLMLDIFACYTLIIPGELNWRAIDYLMFFVSFAGKLLIAACILRNKGPIKLGVYIALAPILAYGLYCGLVFPFVEKTGFSSYVVMNLVIAFMAAAFIAATHFCIVKKDKS